MKPLRKPWSARRQIRLHWLCVIKPNNNLETNSKSTLLVEERLPATFTDEDLLLVARFAHLLDLVLSSKDTRPSEAFWFPVRLPDHVEACRRWVNWQDFAVGVVLVLQLWEVQPSLIVLHDLGKPLGPWEASDEA